MEGQAEGHSLFSVALRMPRALPTQFFGHEVSYQQALMSAAQRRGVAASVVVSMGTEVEISQLISLASNGSDWTVGLQDLLSRQQNRRITVLFYEGDLATLRRVARLAGQHPRTVFIVNLFAREGLLAVPHLSERSMVAGLHLESPTSEQLEDNSDQQFLKQLPRNVSVFADTSKRAFLARSAGVADVRVWPLYSVMQPPSTDRSGSDTAITRVVIPVTGRQVTRQLAYEVASVVAFCQRYGSPAHSFEWYLFGGGYDGHWRRRSRARRMSRLRRLGVKFDPNGLSGEGYVRALADADVVWLPKRGFYTTQSSGKAADALVAGTPVLAPNGSFPAQEMERWVPGAPAYTGAREAAEVFLHSQAIFPALRDALTDRLAEVHRFYSPERAIDEILAVASSMHDELARLPTTPPDAGFHTKPTSRPETGTTEKTPGRVCRIVEARTTHVRHIGAEAWVRSATFFRLR